LLFFAVQSRAATPFKVQNLTLELLPFRISGKTTTTRNEPFQVVE
jgi:hypothetical protein